MPYGAVQTRFSFSNFIGRLRSKPEGSPVSYTRRRSKGISNNDCIHLASAKIRGVTEIHSYEKRWCAASELIEIKVKEPDTLHIAAL